MPFPPADLELRVTVASVDAHAHVVTVTGELDLYSAGSLRERLDPLTSAGSGRVIVDLNGVGFVDSTALGVLTGAAKQLRARGDELVIASDDPRLRKLLEVTGLLGVIAYERSLAEAVERVVRAA